MRKLGCPSGGSKCPAKMLVNLKVASVGPDTSAMNKLTNRIARKCWNEYLSWPEGDSL